jgi:hypothetical protein
MAIWQSFLKTNEWLKCGMNNSNTSHQTWESAPSWVIPEAQTFLARLTLLVRFIKARASAIEFCNITHPTLISRESIEAAGNLTITHS